MGVAPSSGAGRALAQERLRAEIGVKLHMAIGERGGHREVLEKAFQEADIDGDGTITFEEFAKAAASIGLGVSETELRKAFERFDVNHDRTVEFEEVVDFMCPRIVTHTDRQAAATVEHLERLASKRVGLDVDDNHVQGAVLKVAQTVYDKELNIRKVFQKWDGNGSGDLDVSEFTAALNSLGFSLDLLDAKSLFSFFDIDGDGRIKCWEFVRTLGQFEGMLDGGSSSALPGHNTGRGGGGDSNDPEALARQAAAKAAANGGDRIGAMGGNSMASNRSKFADRSKAHQGLAQTNAQAAATAAEREAELAAALAEVEMKRLQLNAQHEALARQQGGAEIEAQRQYQALRQQLLDSQQADAAQADALRQQMIEQRQAMELARAEAEAQAAKQGDIMGWLTGGQAPVDVSDKHAGSVSDVLETGLSRFAHPKSDTDTYQKGVYAWQSSVMPDNLDDEAIIRALTARLKYVHTTAAQALSQVVKEPNVAKNPNAFGEHGVDAPVLMAFAASVLYNLPKKRAEQLLMRARGGKDPAPIISVPKFLSLFANSAEASKKSNQPPLSERLLAGRKVESLTNRERKLLLTMRDYLFEQHGRMQNMFKKCDPDGSGHVTIEEFLNAMTRAGVPVGHGLDRRSDKTISEEEAANIVGFFDQDGDGHLAYHEFMTMLQSTKNSVLTKQVLNGTGLQSGRDIH